MMNQNSMMTMGVVFVITFAVLFFAKPEFVVSNDTMNMSRYMQKPCPIKVTLYSLLVALVVGLLMMMFGKKGRMMYYRNRRMRFF